MGSAATRSARVCGGLVYLQASSRLTVVQSRNAGGINITIDTLKQYDIEKAWAFDAFNTLCRRCDPPTVREGRDLGVDVLAKVAQTREKLAETWGKGSRAALVRDAWAY